MEYSLKWDTDNDGIIDNAGFADQTYDAWSMYGARYDDNIFFWFHTFSSLRSDLNLNDQNVSANHFKIRVEKLEFLHYLLLVKFGYVASSF